MEQSPLAADEAAFSSEEKEVAPFALVSVLTDSSWEWTTIFATTDAAVTAIS